MSVKFIVLSYVIIVARVSLYCSAFKQFSTPQMVRSCYFTHSAVAVCT